MALGCEAIQKSFDDAGNGFCGGEQGHTTDFSKVAVLRMKHAGIPNLPKA